MKFKNSYINRCLNVLNRNNINIKIVSIDYKIYKTIFVNGSYKNIYRNFITIINNQKTYVIKDTKQFDLLYNHLKDLIDLNRLIEETY